MKRKLLLFYDKYFVYKGYIFVYYPEETAPQIIGFSGYKDFRDTLKQFVPKGVKYTVYVDRNSTTYSDFAMCFFFGLFCVFFESII